MRNSLTSEKIAAEAYRLRQDIAMLNNVIRRATEAATMPVAGFDWRTSVPVAPLTDDQDPIVPFAMRHGSKTGPLSRK